MSELCHAAQFTAAGPRDGRRETRVRRASGVQLTLFVDDTAMYFHARYKKSTHLYLQRAIDELGRRFRTWRIEVIPDKSGSYEAQLYDLICRPRNVLINPPDALTTKLSQVSPNNSGFGQKIELTAHPPYSPDLAPDDFYLFPSVKNKLRGQSISKNEEAVDAFWRYLNQNGKSGFNLDKSASIMANILKNNKTILNDICLYNDVRLRCDLSTIGKSPSASCLRTLAPRRMSWNGKRLIGDHVIVDAIKY
ncbi:hypothetical protein EVAR_40424_1 [Eumeta japonica]|uniref:Mariner Mos1 transposase n=1 Tax=Eumeta variegata TaxID=151549 RepID=A0A4C1SDZ3_EUMVA|nr:hypothetical protein EVAR_40424_1 [Eumeta japonica]